LVLSRFATIAWRARVRSHAARRLSLQSVSLSSQSKKSNPSPVSYAADIGAIARNASGPLSLNQTLFRSTTMPQAIQTSDAIAIGSEILVNTTTAGPQGAPAITGLANGGFVVTWTDFSQTGGDTSQSAVRAQVFAADGSEAGSEILVPTTTLGMQSAAAITGLSDGRFIIAWQDASGAAGDDSGAAVRAQIFNADGTRSGAEFLVNTMIQDTQGEQTIAVLADGHFVVAWTDYSATGADQSDSAIRAQIFNPDGTRLGDEFLVNTTTARTQYEPAISGLSNGDFVISWSDQSGDADSYGVRAQIFHADSTRSGSEFLVNTTTDSGQVEPTIAALADGHFVVAWADGSGADSSAFSIRAQVFSDDATKLGAEHIVNTTTDLTQWQPTIAALAKGGFAVA
jgi:hypothetical protein